MTQHHEDLARVGWQWGMKGEEDSKIKYKWYFQP